MGTMENVLTILGLLAAVGLAGSIVWLIISLIKKKPFKKPLITVGSTLVAFLVLMYCLGSNVQSNALDTTSSSTTSTKEETQYAEGIGDITFIKGLYPDEAISIDPIGVAISGVKVFRVNNPEASIKSDIERQTGEPVGDSFYYMTVSFTAVTAEDDVNVEWMGLASVTLDDGTWLNQEDDDMFLGQDSDGNEITPYFKGVQMKEYMQMYVLDSPDINSVQLEFDQVSDAYSSETITPSKTVTYKFD
jgi:hypothetical protein